MLAGIQLDHEKKLSDCPIDQDSVFHMVLRLTGRRGPNLKIIKILYLDLENSIEMQIEREIHNSLEKAFYMTEIDPALYDLFYEDMKIRNSNWDFEDET